MNALRHILLLVALCSALAAGAQRRITPVEPVSPGTVKVETDTVEGGRPESVVETTDMSGRTILVDTISGVEYRDTILTEAPKLLYQKFHAVTIGVNVWDPVMRCLGQHYGLIGFWGELSIHNWIKPIVEAGLGQADSTPDNGNFTYKSSMAPYFKIGVNYNFLYNSNPDYSVYLGVRYGLSNFSYEVTDVTVSQGYWGDDIAMSVPSQRVTAGYFEAALGLRVMIWKNVGIGWDVRMHKVIHQTAAQYGNPWYIPGFGSRSSTFSASFSVSYTIPLSKKVQPAPAAAEE